MFATEMPPTRPKRPLVRGGRYASPCHLPPKQDRLLPIENEPALEHFHRALARLVAGADADKKVRILAYGASHTQSDLYTGYLRAYLQGRFGNGGQGFVLLGRVNRWYRTLDTGVWHKGMRVRYAHDRDVNGEPLGLFGAAAVGRSGVGFAEILTAKDSRDTQFELHYLQQPGGGGFSLLVDGKLVARIHTRADVPRPGYHAFETTPGRHTIRVQLDGRGPVRLFGMVAETATPGVVIDTLGISGSRMADSLRWDQDSWIEAVRHRNPHLVMFAYGTNEVMGGLGSIASYEQKVGAVLARLREAAPDTSCVLIAPFDMSKREKGLWASPSGLEQTIEAQRRISRELGCGFWDGHAFMGGAGSIARWAKTRPPLASVDHVHLTRRGYVYVGVGLGDALMRAFDRKSDPLPVVAVSQPQPP